MQIIFSLNSNIPQLPRQYLEGMKTFARCVPNELSMRRMPDGLVMSRHQLRNEGVQGGPVTGIREGDVGIGTDVHAASYQFYFGTFHNRPGYRGRRSAERGDLWLADRQKGGPAARDHS
jgi:hypothetical protein